MEERNIFDRLERVGGPRRVSRAGSWPSFPGARSAGLASRRTYRYAFAGAAAVLLAAFVLVNVFVLRKPGDVSVAGKRTASGPVAIRSRPGHGDHGLFHRSPQRILRTANDIHTGAGL